MIVEREYYVKLSEIGKENKITKVMLFIFVYFIYNGKEELFKFSKI